MRAQEWRPDRDRIAAASTALLLPALAIAWLLFGQPRPQLDPRSEAPLQVVWIARTPPAPATVAAALPRRPATGPVPAPQSRRPDSPPAPPVPAARPADADAVADGSPAARASGLTAVFIAQALADDSGRSIDFEAAPLEHRRRPAPADGRFRVRAPPSPAQRVAAVGAMLNGGYEADPCPRIQRNLAVLATAPGGLRDEEVRRHQRLCQ